MTPDFLPLACCLSDPAHLLQPETEADPLWRRLHQLAHQKLQRWGGQLRLQPRRDRPGREILDWRELSLRIPPVILAGAVAPLRQIRLLDPSIAPPVPVAQLHVHLGNGFFFELLWSHRASRMIWDHPDEKPLPPPPTLFSDLPFRHAASKEARWNTLLKLGFLLRAELDARCKDGPSPFGQPPSAATLRAWIAGIFQGELPLRHLRPAGLWLRDRPRPYPEHREIQSIWEQDPCYDGEACPEVGLLHRCFQKLLTGQADADFPDLFGGYLRILGLAYRGVTADPEAAGLDAFQRVYDAGSTFAQGAQTVAEEVISQEEGLRLAAVELRLGHAAALVEQARKTPRSSGEEVRKSWLFHFKRQARPKENGPPGWLERYGRHARDATLLETAIQGNPGILEQFRGLDVAGREREEPLWSIAPALLRVREASLATKPLGLTLHVGEDTPHLASGLRAIHEPFIWGLIQRGDRLGHAIALGRDPLQWALKNRQVRVPRWTRLLDLAWLHFCCGRYDLGGPAALEEEAERLQTEIFGTSDTLAAWAELWEQLGSPHFLRGTLGFPNGCPRPQGAVGLFHDYLYRQSCFVAGEEEVEVETTNHLWMVEQIQRKLLREIESWQVVIEVNPTSNWIVARTGGILDQPMYHLRPVHARPDHPSLPLALCTDDPLAFSTCLADEYAYAWAGLNGAGIPSSYAREWLRDAAEVSVRAAF